MEPEARLSQQKLVRKFNIDEYTKTLYCRNPQKGLDSLSHKPDAV